MLIDDDDEIEYHVERTKFLVGSGCLIVGFILLVAFIYSVFVLTSKINHKPEDTYLVVSKSPKQNHTIRVVQKGTLSFGDPIVVISFENFKIQRVINNHRKSLTSSDISINWKNNDEATILLSGERQDPEVIEFNVPDKGSNVNPFQVVQKELGLFPFKKSESPNHVNVVELRKLTYSKGMYHYNDNVPIQVYYGKVGGKLQKYGEFSGSNPYNISTFNIYWKGDKHVIIYGNQYDKSGTESMEVEFK
ncbi:hypothetical protein HPT25_27750 [Bacillus sp. BRMEA1]|uniref:hypothetical protein n=1 Tax=Neobacillus endophyticus TaxID=2738405 RepID=UPI0015654953|nr:hypothetical protein [Neobacillus endophyticus]NRD81091.1 hypothetical protein [Neobacillus endophyticus]